MFFPLLCIFGKVFLDALDKLFLYHRRKSDQGNSYQYLVILILYQKKIKRSVIISQGQFTYFREARIIIHIQNTYTFFPNLINSHQTLELCLQLTSVKSKSLQLCRVKNLENKLSIPGLKIQEEIYCVVFNIGRVSLQQGATLDRSNNLCIKLEAEWTPWKLFLGFPNCISISTVSSIADMSQDEDFPTFLNSLINSTSED